MVTSQLYDWSGTSEATQCPHNYNYHSSRQGPDILFCGIWCITKVTSYCEVSLVSLRCVCGSISLFHLKLFIKLRNDTSEGTGIHDFLSSVWQKLGTNVTFHPTQTKLPVWLNECVGHGSVKFPSFSRRLFKKAHISVLSIYCTWSRSVVHLSLAHQAHMLSYMW